MIITDEQQQQHQAASSMTTEQITTSNEDGKYLALYLVLFVAVQCLNLPNTIAVSLSHSIIVSIVL